MIILKIDWGMEKVITINILKNKNALKIGIAFFFQKFHKINTSKFDVKLDYILTEKGIFKFIMNILILGDVVGLSGRKALDINLQKL